MTSTRPYLIRAIHEWIVDNGMTPHLLAATESDEVLVPRQYEDNGKIVLNIGPSAVKTLSLGDDAVTFDARFDGQPMRVSVPVHHVLAIYTRENGRGMMFGDEEDTPPTGNNSPGGDAKPDKSHLKVVK